MSRLKRQRTRSRIIWLRFSGRGRGTCNANNEEANQFETGRGIEGLPSAPRMPSGGLPVPANLPRITGLELLRGGPLPQHSQIDFALAISEL